MAYADFGLSGQIVSTICDNRIYIYTCNWKTFNCFGTIHPLICHILLQKNEVILQYLLSLADIWFGFTQLALGTT